MTVESGQLYQHFKGGIYEVLHVAKSTDPDREEDEEFVVYRAWPMSESQVYVRSLWNFTQIISHALGNGHDCVDAHMCPHVTRRFTLIGTTTDGL